VLLATIVVIGSSFPHSDKDYKIPAVGSGQRSQYYVLHSDGTFKYGFDTGAGAFESVKAHSPGDLHGNFGYVDPDGKTIRLEYEAGEEGFVARGDHLPKPSPELAQALAAVVRSNRPFVDPLAGKDGDASYGFNFQSEGHSRNEQSDSDGTVTGSYSYVDENGVTRSFTYKAGKGIGFVIKGDGLTEDVNSVANDGNKRTINYVAGSSTGFQAQGDHLPKAPESQFGGRATVSQRRAPSSRVNPSSFPSHRTSSKPFPFNSVRRRNPQTSQIINNSPILKSSVRQHKPFSSGTFSSASQRGSHQQTTFTPSKRTSITSPHRYKEEANIRSSVTPQGSYSFSYDTSSHSRSQSGNDDNDVIGDFAFVAEDDGIRREINYEAGSGTGFIAEGVHIPVGPIVPGSPSGQPTGRLVRVFSPPFVDPLADGNSDASYNFGFDSDTYSRSETADEDGNIVGTYTIVEEDGTTITYKFKAGKGIGFETEEVSRFKGPVPAKPTPNSGHKLIETKTNLGATRRTQTSTVRKSKRPSSIPHSTISTSYASKSEFPQTKSSFKHSSFSASKTGTRSSFTPSTILKSSFKPNHAAEVFPGFTLHSYAADPSADKFGYVLKFDN
ncbi:UNVERIFIED_CONTAM: hypothetical protein GTU68_018205, partial [Idotea baltica]|nr:hypothetical protein [Idotea baltica]